MTTDTPVNPCPICNNEHLAYRTDIYKDKRIFVYCDHCGAMSTRDVWQLATQHQTIIAPVLNEVLDIVQGASSDFIEGQMAHINGIKLNENPYSEGDKSYAEWRAGWSRKEFDRITP